MLASRLSRCLLFINILDLTSLPDQSMTITNDNPGLIQSYTNLAWEEALRTHMCERGVVPRLQLYSTICPLGLLTGTPWIYAPLVNLLAQGANPSILVVPSL